MEIFKVKPEDRLSLFDDVNKHYALLDHVVSTCRTVDHGAPAWFEYVKCRVNLTRSGEFSQAPLQSATKLLNHAISAGVVNNAAPKMYEKLVSKAFYSHYAFVGYDGEYEQYARTDELYDKVTKAFGEMAKVFKKLYYTALAAYKKPKKEKR